MPQTTPFLPGISHLLMGRAPRRRLDQLRQESRRLQAATLSRLWELFGSWLPEGLLVPSGEGTNSRERDYPLSVTFWAFLSQVLNPGSPCRETVRKVQAWHVQHGRTPPQSGDSAYCQARGRLPVETLNRMHTHLVDTIEAQTPASAHWRGREVLVVDGTGLSMPDTPDNQEAWPQHVQRRLFFPSDDN